MCGHVRNKGDQACCSEIRMGELKRGPSFEYIVRKIIDTESKGCVTKL